MRKIKFKIWDSGRKEWLHDGKPDGINLFGETIVFGEILRRPDDTSVTLEELNNLVALQYTGLKDKNGVEIYEGDICRFVNIENGDIEVSPIIFERANFTTNWSSQGLGILFSIYDGDIEIIGNIYENPELVEEAK